MVGSRAGIAFAFVLIVCNVCAGAEGWRTYTNTRFGAAAQVPANWAMDPEPDNNDGRSFTSPDKRAKIVIAGIRAEIVAPDEDMALRAKPNDGEVITYQKRAKGWIVVSGTRGETIFYRKSILTCRGSIWNDLSIEYPSADQGKYDALVKRVSASVRGVKGYDTNGCS